MGMDVNGKAPTSKEGEYFWASVWTWHPLWDLCCAVAPLVIGEETARDCQYNDGKGLDAEQAKLLADALERALEIGIEKVRVLRPSRSEAADAMMQMLGGSVNENARGSWYELQPERIRVFVQFLRACGGFEVW